MTAHYPCPACDAKDFATCVQCGTHYLPASPSGQCFDCRASDTT